MTRMEHIALKGTRDGLILYFDPGVEFSVVLEELTRYLRESTEFLRGASVRCFAGEKGYADEELRALTTLLGEYEVELAGWLKPEEVYAGSVVLNPKESPPWQEEGMAEGPCLFVDRTLRSGHSVQYEGHVVVLGDVNPGAEIVAGGNIVVLGTLRGVAHAGATGDRGASVSAGHLRPTQLRIADRVARAPDEEVEAVGPEIARIKNGQLFVERLTGTMWRSSLR
ncbi:septum site-determining protein MinC [Peptococcaceae bacterium CEB3]|nr:septum site-determining protein MinC [Peptococcaceae bacterium CEB3]